jgi:hypothetical protein
MLGNVEEAASSMGEAGRESMQAYGNAGRRWW